MTIYVRTAAGNKAALNPDSALPRKLRTLLISIDGRSPLDTYVKSLSSFGDVESLIESLLQAGLIQMAGPQSGTHVASQEALGSGLGTPPSVDWRSTDLGNTTLPGTAGRGAQAPVDDVASWSKFQQPLVASAPSYNPPAPKPQATTAQYQLRSAIGLMSDFVSQHMPMESLELVLTLEGLTSVEQVIGSLKGYQSLIEHLGQPARDHLAKLRTLLTSA